MIDCVSRLDQRRVMRLSPSGAEALLYRQGNASRRNRFSGGRWSFLIRRTRGSTGAKQRAHPRARRPRPPPGCLTNGVVSVVHGPICGMPAHCRYVAVSPDQVGRSTRATVRAGPRPCCPVAPYRTAASSRRFSITSANSSLSPHRRRGKQTRFGAQARDDVIEHLFAACQQRKVFQAADYRDGPDVMNQCREHRLFRVDARCPRAEHERQRGHVSGSPPQRLHAPGEDFGIDLKMLFDQATVDQASNLLSSQACRRLVDCRDLLETAEGRAVTMLIRRAVREGSS